MREPRTPSRDDEGVQQRAALLVSPLFQAMRAEELDAVLRLSSVRRVPRGQMIFQKGDEGTSMMAVLRGRVRISVVSADGRELTLNVINPGEIFGEIALLDGNPRSADAVAIESTDLLMIERRSFLPFLRANDDLYARLLAVLCARLRQTSLALEDLALFTLPTRLARVLLNLARDYGRSTPAGTRIELKLSQRDLSNLVGASREAVNKQLGQWRDTGVLAKDGNSMVIMQTNILASFVL